MESVSLPESGVLMVVFPPLLWIELKIQSMLSFPRSSRLSEFQSGKRKRTRFPCPKKKGGVGVPPHILNGLNKQINPCSVRPRFSLYSDKPGWESRDKVPLVSSGSPPCSVLTSQAGKVETRFPLSPRAPPPCSVLTSQRGSPNALSPRASFPARF